MKLQNISDTKNLLSWPTSTSPFFAGHEPLKQLDESYAAKEWDEKLSQCTKQSPKAAGKIEALQDYSMAQQLHNLHLWRLQLRLALGFFALALPVFYVNSASSVPLLGFSALCLGFLLVFQVANRVLATAFSMAQTATCLHNLSTTDVVTGGYNRLHMEKTLEHEIARAARGNHPISLVAFDLDNFKAVNDQCGHATGDEVLREVYHAACGAIRKMDIIGRFGGDEFLVVLPETDADAALHLAKRLQHDVKANLRCQFSAETPQSQVTLSIGVATLQNEIVSVEEFVNLADGRLYAAKRDGKNCIKELH